MTTEMKKVWFVDGQIIEQEIPESEIYKQEPVAWMDRDGDIYKELPNEYWNPPHTPIYTKREWVGLTDEEVERIKLDGRDLEFVSMTALHRFARDIQAKLKEKNSV
jgi:hypothetical protein